MKQKGFTLIEAVVSAGVFAFVVSSIVGVYLSAIQIDRKTRSQRVVTENARFITEFLSKEIRNGVINYYDASCPLGSLNSLCIVNEANENEYIHSDRANCTVSLPCDLILEKNGGFTSLNSTTVKITNLRFYVEPDEDPFDLANNVHEQPRVTLVLGLVSNFGVNAQERVRLNLQSTFSPRYYPSRE